MNFSIAAEGMLCPDLVPPENGGVEFTTSIGDTAVYMCDDGFILSGNSVRLCLPGGIWNGSDPVCNRKTLQLADVSVERRFYIIFNSGTL